MITNEFAIGYDGFPETRKGYTGYEKDDESGLDFAQARYYNPKHGRYTSVDPLTASANVKNPQTFNRYTYVLNSPYKFSDPLGLIAENTGYRDSTGTCGAEHSSCDDSKFSGGFLNPTEEPAPESQTPDAGEPPASNDGGGGDEQQAAPPAAPPAPTAEQNADSEGLPSPPPPEMPDDISRGMKDWLRQTEAFRSKPYSNDGSGAGNCTIGYGHKLGSGTCGSETIEKYGNGITNEEALALFEQDLQAAINIVRTYITVDLNINQFDALVSFAYRLGEGSFKKSETRAQINQGNYDVAGDKILNWGGKRGAGQASRANGEWSRYFGGDFKGVAVPSSLEFRLVIAMQKRALPAIPN